MSTPYLGQISMFGGNFAPKGFAFCNGQLLSIAQNSALFSLLGTIYGGDGKTTFALPNLQSQLPVHVGHGPGLSNYNLGQAGGSPNVTITVSTMPAHMHSLEATQALGTTQAIGTSVIPAQATGDSSPLFYGAAQSGQPSLAVHPMDPNACGVTGGNQPHINLMPSLCVSFIIALQGIFPSRN